MDIYCHNALKVSIENQMCPESLLMSLYLMASLPGDDREFSPCHTMICCKQSNCSLTYENPFGGTSLLEERFPLYRVGYKLLPHDFPSAHALHLLNVTSPSICFCACRFSIRLVREQQLVYRALRCAIFITSAASFQCVWIFDRLKHGSLVT